LVTQPAWIIADASVWIHHLGGGVSSLPELLKDGRLMMHTAVIGEVALGSLRNRERTLELMRAMAPAEEADELEVLRLVNAAPLYSRGIGWVDAHLVASAILSDAKLLTRDRRLAEVAQELGVGIGL
jgi:hypothetical protein